MADNEQKRSYREAHGSYLDPFPPSFSGSTQQPLANYWEMLFSEPQTAASTSTNDIEHDSVRLSEFRESLKKDVIDAFKSKLNNLVNTAPSQCQKAVRRNFKNFEKLFLRFLEQNNQSVIWSEIKPPPEEYIKSYKDISSKPIKCSEKELLDKLVVVKLNGGLGTIMGCKGPKSLIAIRNGLNFLDLTVNHIESLNKRHKVDVPLVLMNSYHTDDDTRSILQRYSACQVKIHTFKQNRYPRIRKETLLPTPQKFDDPVENWYPPGHGDIYECFAESGLLDQFIKEGRKVMFMSNIDNLGATVDLHILRTILKQARKEKPSEFIMEVTDKTRADVKGGTLIEYENKLRLLELAQVPKEHEEEFKTITKFKIFNTNNLWVNLEAMKRVYESGEIEMEISVNKKTLANGTNVIQLETASGAGIKYFNNSIGINVPRSRFAPVKKTSDLLLIMSNLYDLADGALVISPRHQFPTNPLIKLGIEHFEKLNAFQSRFPTIPDMLELDHLTVSGDVTFGKDITLKGTVIIIANHGEKINIPSGSYLENKIVSGNLRILDY